MDDAGTSLSGFWEIYPDGSSRQLYEGVSGIQDATPSWSPDGTQLALSASTKAWDIHVIDADGGNRTILVDWEGTSEGYPEWSPDGTQLVFASGSISASEGIFVIGVDGSGLQQLTDRADYRPVWSPDGSRILFMSNRDGNMAVYVMDSDGSNQTNLTNDPGYDGLGAPDHATTQVQGMSWAVVKTQSAQRDSD